MGTAEPLLEKGQGALDSNLVLAALRDLGVQGVLLTLAQEGKITEVACQMPECLCPEELGGRKYFEPLGTPLTHWMPTQDHIELKSAGGQRSVDNSRLAHRLCNRVDYNRNQNIPFDKDLESVEEARRQALEHRDEN